jgi:hypothetical protein
MKKQPIKYIDNAAKYSLTKREYFAAMAMQGICTNLEHLKNTYERTPEHELIVTKSIRIADELLKQLES